MHCRYYVSYDESCRFSLIQCNSCTCIMDSAAGNMGRNCHQEFSDGVPVEYVRGSSVHPSCIRLYLQRQIVFQFLVTPSALLSESTSVSSSSCFIPPKLLIERSGMFSTIAFIISSLIASPDAFPAPELLFSQPPIAFIILSLTGPNIFAAAGLFMISAIVVAAVTTNAFFTVETTSTAAVRRISRDELPICISYVPVAAY